MMRRSHSFQPSASVALVAQVALQKQGGLRDLRGIGLDLAGTSGEHRRSMGISLGKPSKSSHPKPEFAPEFGQPEYNRNESRKLGNLDREWRR